MSETRCTLQVQGLDCPKEVDALTAALKDRSGVGQMGFDLIHGTMTVDYDDRLVDPAALVRLIAERTGLQSALEGQVEQMAPSWWARRGRWVVTVGSGLALAAGMAYSWLGPSFGLNPIRADQLARGFYGLAVVIGGIGIFPRATRNLVRLRFDIDVLMGLAILGAMALGQWDEAATVAFLYGLSESLESLSLDYARRSIRALLELAPPTAERIAGDGSTQKVAASDIRRGERILVRSGDTIPVDGAVARGRSSVDQKTITGESVPVLREEGDLVYAGTINGDGTLEVTASGPVGDALISRVIAQVRATQAGPGADRETDLAVCCRLHANCDRDLARGHAGPATLGHRCRWCQRVRGRALARVVCARTCGACDRLSVCPGDRHAGGCRLRAGSGGTWRRVDSWRRIPRRNRPAARDRL